MIQNLPIGSLRLWLNEERIKDPERFVTNEELMFMLGMITKEELEASREKREKIEKGAHDFATCFEGVMKDLAE